MLGRRVLQAWDAGLSRFGYDGQLALCVTILALDLGDYVMIDTRVL